MSNQSMNHQLNQQTNKLVSTSDLVLITILQLNKKKKLAKMAKYHIFQKFLAKKHYFGNKWQTTTFSRTRVSKTQVPHQFCHCGTAELEFVRLKKIMWYSSLVNSHTMQHSTRVYQARVPFKKKKNYTVLEFDKLGYYVNFFFCFFFWGGG